MTFSPILRPNLKLHNNSDVRREPQFHNAVMMRPDRIHKFYANLISISTSNWSKQSALNCQSWQRDWEAFRIDGFHSFHLWVSLVSEKTSSHENHWWFLSDQRLAVGRPKQDAFRTRWWTIHHFSGIRQRIKIWSIRTVSLFSLHSYAKWAMKDVPNFPMIGREYEWMWPKDCLILMRRVSKSSEKELHESSWWNMAAESWFHKWGVAMLTGYRNKNA